MMLFLFLNQSRIMDKSYYNTYIKPLLVEDTMPVIEFLQGKGLIKTQVSCDLCQVDMKMFSYKNAVTDKYVWRCVSRECPKFHCPKSIRIDSFFFRSRLSLQTWIQIIYCWSIKMTQVQTATFANINTKTATKCYSSIREACSTHLRNSRIELGGPGAVIQLDESLFSKKAKYHRGRVGKKQIWVFGILDTSQTPAIGYMEIVPKRDAATLLPIIQRIVRPGSVIYSDEWRSYRHIQRDLGLVHHTVNHSLHFVDPITGINTQAIEAYWSAKKSVIKTMRGCRRKLLQGYLDEFMWRDRFQHDPMSNLFQHISLQYP